MIDIDPADLILVPVEVVLRRPDGSKRSVRVEGDGLFRDPVSVAADVRTIFASAAGRAAAEDGTSGTNFAPVSWKFDGALVFEAEEIASDGTVARSDVHGRNVVEACADAAFRVAAGMLETEPRFLVSSRGYLSNLHVAMRSVLDSRSFFAVRRIPRPADLERMCAALERQGLVVSPADADVVATIRRHVSPARQQDRQPDRRSQGIDDPVVVEFRVPWKDLDDDGNDLAETTSSVVPMPGDDEDLGDWLRSAATKAGILPGETWTLAEISFYGPRIRSTGIVHAVDVEGDVRRLRETVVAPHRAAARLKMVVAAALAGLAGTGHDGVPVLEDIAAAMSAAPASLRIEIEDGFDAGFLVNAEWPLSHWSEEKPGAVVRAFAARLLAQIARNDPAWTPETFRASKQDKGFRHPGLHPAAEPGPVPIDLEASARIFGVGEDAHVPGF